MKIAELTKNVSFLAIAGQYSQSYVRLIIRTQWLFRVQLHISLLSSNYWPMSKGSTLIFPLLSSCSKPWDPPSHELDRVAALCSFVSLRETNFLERKGLAVIWHALRLRSHQIQCQGHGGIGQVREGKGCSQVRLGTMQSHVKHISVLVLLVFLAWPL